MSARVSSWWTIVFLAVSLGAMIAAIWSGRSTDAAIYWLAVVLCGIWERP